MTGDWTSSDGMASVLLGDVFARLGDLPAGSVHTVVTSPPYWGLRDYGTGTWEGGDPACDHVAPTSGGPNPEDGCKRRGLGNNDKQFRGVCGKCGARRIDQQLGSEPTLDEYLARMVAVFREVRRVLRDDGTLWLNMGDCYGDGSRDRLGNRRDRAACNQRGSDRRAEPGNQLLQPHRLAMAMQADGWTLRSTVIWAKRSPMPESLSGVRWVRCRVKVSGGWTRETHPAYVGPDEYDRAHAFGTHGGEKEGPGAVKWQDCQGCDKCRPNGGYVLRRGAWRPTTAHEYVFLLTKGMGYFADGERAKERSVGLKNGSRNGNACPKGSGRNDGFQAAVGGETSGRNPRSVWTLSSEPFKGAHFATFPPTLVYRCLLAATSPVGCCPQCGAPWAPMVSSERVATRPGLASKFDLMQVAATLGTVNKDPMRHTTTTAVHGYRPTCCCRLPPGHELAGVDGVTADPIPMTVLDPFSGSGTTGHVARSMGLRYVGIELNPAYLEMSTVRIETPWKPKAERRTGSKRRRKHRRQTELFT